MCSICKLWCGVCLWVGVAYVDLGVGFGVDLGVGLGVYAVEVGLVRLRGSHWGTCSIGIVVYRLLSAHYTIPIILIFVKYRLYVCSDNIQYVGV